MKRWNFGGLRRLPTVSSILRTAAPWFSKPVHERKSRQDFFAEKEDEAVH